MPRSRTEAHSSFRDGQGLTFGRTTAPINLDHYTHLHSIPALDGIKPDVGFVEMPDGTKLRYARIVAHERPQDTVVLLPGKGGMIDVSQPLANAYAQSGYNVFVLEPRGQGGSGRRVEDMHKTDVWNFGLYRSDTAAFITHIRQLFPIANDNLVMPVAHSMTGAALAPGVPGADGLVALAPMIEAKKLPLKGPLAIFYKGVSHALCAIGQGDLYAFSRGKRDFSPENFPTNEYTNDPDNYQRLQEVKERNKDIGTYGPTFRWGRSAYDNARELKRIPDGSLNSPMLVVLAEYDRIVRNSTARRFFARKFAPDSLTVETIEDTRHQLDNAAPDALARIVELTDRFGDNIRASRPESRSSWSYAAATQ